MSILGEPLLFCLLTSLIWAPIVLIATKKVADGETKSDRIWLTGLVIAALPVMLAPAAASFGLSLRQPTPLPPLSDPLAGIDLSAAAPVASVAAAPLRDPMRLVEMAGLFYLYGLALFLTLAIGRRIWFSYRVRYTVELDEPRLLAALNDWRMRMGIRRTPQYAFTDAVNSVCVHGIFRPVVLFPMALLDRVSVDDAALMGAHEMAHIKRGDVAFFAFCDVIRAIFWFNPFVHRMTAHANLAAEQAADALVIANGVARREYANCFVAGLKFAATERRPDALTASVMAMAPSFTPFDKKSRRNRLDAILSGAQAGSTSVNKAALGGLAIIAVALSAAQASFAVSPGPAEDALTVAPVSGDITLGFRDTSYPLGEDRPYHEGVDIKAPKGAVVRAAGDGKVIDATARYNGKDAWGKVVVIDHGHGLVTRYAHLNSYDVRKGQKVMAGDPIATVGASGKATKPHLHFEVILDGEFIDPTPIVDKKERKAAVRTLRGVLASEDGAVMIAPAPKAAPSPKLAPRAAPAPAEAGNVDTIDTKKLSELEEKLRARLAGAQMQFEEIGGIEFDFDDFGDLEFEMADMEEFFTEEDRRALAEAQARAIEEAGRAMRDMDFRFRLAAADLASDEAARERIEKDRERAMARAERERERAERRAERERERMEKNRERAERDRDRAHRDMDEKMREKHKKMERDHEARMKNSRAHREEMLRQKEEALRRAKADLERQLEEIERQRAELRKQQASSSTN